MDIGKQGYVSSMAPGRAALTARRGGAADSV